MHKLTLEKSRRWYLVGRVYKCHCHVQKLAELDVQRLEKDNRKEQGFIELLAGRFPTMYVRKQRARMKQYVTNQSLTEGKIGISQLGDCFGFRL